MRIAQPFVVIDAHGAVTVPVLDQQFDRRITGLGGFDNIPQAIAIVRHAVHRDDLRSDGQAGSVGGTAPLYIRQLVFPAHNEAEREGEVGEFPAGLTFFDKVRRRVGIGQSVAAARDAVEWRLAVMAFKTRTQETCPIIWLQSIQRSYYIVEDVRLRRRPLAVIDAEKYGREVVQRFLPA